MGIIGYIANKFGRFGERIGGEGNEQKERATGARKESPAEAQRRKAKAMAELDVWMDASFPEIKAKWSEGYPAQEAWSEQAEKLWGAYETFRAYMYDAFLIALPLRQELALAKEWEIEELFTALPEQLTFSEPEPSDEMIDRILGKVSYFYEFAHQDAERSAEQQASAVEEMRKRAKNLAG